MQELENLKSEATDLGVKYNANIGAAKLKQKIDEHYASLETGSPEVAVEEVDDTAKVKPKKSGASTLEERVEEQFKLDSKMHIITIIDNDQRVNNQTTTCSVGYSNQFHDFGQRMLPLNERVEVAQGHINILKSVMIPLHTHDPKTGLSKVKMRNRYSITYD